ncbi:methyltransferase domain-containing protein [Pusillimonas sp. SM2304]|uniref:methyltransferase domain-containing protein n=1 Tax=Pusillimonas sp. SM2304 TaxID=3073241 RepID=UPI002874BCEC|nr:methyltransferase domain-containing protein [Pusillimonas sp. SM2304]MDS1139294.1 methyltransferase domain-containing protein [Pusillimonas sp. SM2304]
MSQPPSLRINPAHVRQQFARRSPLDAAQFLYGEVAQRMLQRLSYIRIAPVTVLDAGCGAGHALEPLRARYPTLDYAGLDNCAALLDVARERYVAKPGLWQKLRNKPTPPVRFVQADMASSGLAPESQDLVWSNMALHWHPEPHDVLSEWRRILKPGALVMFSCLGPGSLAELRSAIERAGLATATPEFVDMHDFGDLLIERGFADPVMDQEILTLTYRTPQKLLEDMRVLGGNPSMDRKQGLSGRAWQERLLNALEAQRGHDGTIHLSLEVAYGHAWRSAAYQAMPGETRISVGSIGRSKDPNNTRPTVKPRKSDKP